MKHGYLLVLLFAQFVLVSGQNIDSIEDYVLKYKHLEFLNIDNQTIPMTLFVQPDGNFFLRNGHVERPNNVEKVIHYSLNKKGKQLAQSDEKYENASDGLIDAAINNYFPKVIIKPKSDYFMSYIEEYSMLLQLFKEPVLSKTSDSNIIRIVSPCYDYMDNLKKQHYQSFNMIRVQFDTISILIYKTGHFDEKTRFVIDFEYTYYLNGKEKEQIMKQICGINFIDDSIYFRNNSDMQMLFEFKNNGKCFVFLRAVLYEDKVEDLSYFTGLFNRLLSIIRGNFYETIGKCR